MLDLIKWIFDFAIHIDRHLIELVSNYELWVYVILFAIIFAETGLVIFPFLPGDSLLFASGAVAALERTPSGIVNPMNIFVVIIIIFSAAFLGDHNNYFMGKYLGKRVFEKNYRFIRKEYLMQTHNFYEKYGGRTLIIARFMPIIRTFAPFVAGVGSMTYTKFLRFCVLGNSIWVLSICFAGYFLGNIPWVQHNFSTIIIGIIIVSTLPPVIGVINHKLKAQKQKKEQKKNQK